MPLLIAIPFAVIFGLAMGASTLYDAVFVAKPKLLRELRLSVDLNTPIESLLSRLFSMSGKIPDQAKGPEEVIAVVLAFERFISLENARKRLQENGLRPANPRELIAFAATGWDGQHVLSLEGLGRAYHGELLARIDTFCGKKLIDLETEHPDGIYPGTQILAIRQPRSLHALPEHCATYSVPVDNRHHHSVVISVSRMRFIRKRSRLREFLLFWKKKTAFPDGERRAARSAAEKLT